MFFCLGPLGLASARPGSECWLFKMPDDESFFDPNKLKA